MLETVKFSIHHKVDQIGSFSQQQEPRMFGPFMAGGFGHCNVTHQSFGSEAGDFWHGG